MAVLVLLLAAAAVAWYRLRKRKQERDAASLYGAQQTEGGEQQQIHPNLHQQQQAKFGDVPPTGSLPPPALYELGTNNLHSELGVNSPAGWHPGSGEVSRQELDGGRAAAGTDRAWGGGAGR